MMPLIVIGLLVGLPVVATLLLRVNGSLVLLALCAGSVLQQFVGTDTGTLFGSMSAGGSLNGNYVAQLVLLLLPAVLTIVFLRKSVSAGKMLLNLLPSIAAGAVAVLLTVPLLPGGTRYNIMNSSLWSSISQYQAAIVAGAMLVGFVSLWVLHPKHGKDKKRGK